MAEMHAPELRIEERLPEHEAVRAWRRLHSGQWGPSSVHPLHQGKKSAVYRLSGIGPAGEAIVVKRCRKASAQIERMIYEEFLPRLSVPTLRCHGFLDEPDEEFCWLFLEDAVGEPYSPLRVEHRALAARWLGEMHLTPLPPELKARLPVRDLNHYRQLLRRCRASLLDHLERDPVLSADDAGVVRNVLAHCVAVELHWSHIENICAVMPQTLVHDDFVVKNVRIRDGASGRALLVFDWEFAGWGVPGTDLAQFVGFVASPDLTVYCSALQREHPGLRPRALEEVAICGNLLRSIDAIGWVTSGWKLGSRDFALQAVSELPFYHVDLAKALGALRWS